MNSDLDVDVLVCQTGNCFITITWPSSQTRAEWDTAFQISPTYLYFQPCKGLCSRRPISGMVMTVISLFPNMSVSCCRAERTEGRREKTKKGRKRVIVTKSGWGCSRHGREMSYCIPEGDARMWNKHTQRPERAMKKEENTPSLPPSLPPTLSLSTSVWAEKLFTSFKLDSYS